MCRVAVADPEQLSAAGWHAYPVPRDLPAVVINDPALPLVSVVTPSYNQGRFIRETIESVLGQDYPNLEYWVIDGGSTDGTVAILAEYAGDPRFHWISEPDRGQADAINKGWSRCRGDILAWLNSDDCYASNRAVRAQVESLAANPAAGLVYGDGYFVDQEGSELTFYPTRDYSYRDLLRMNYIMQPTVFIRRDIVRLVGPLDLSFRFAMDRDYWLRCTTVTALHYSPEPIATYRLHADSKTVDSYLALNIEGFGATCKHLSADGARRLTKQQRASLVASTLLILAVRAIRTGELDLARRLTRGARRLEPWNPRHASVALALLDWRTGWNLQPKLAGVAFFLLNRRLRHNRVVNTEYAL